MPSHWGLGLKPEEFGGEANTQSTAECLTATNVAITVF